MTNSGTIKEVLDLYKQGYSMIGIARVLNMHIHEVAEIINDYT